MDFKEFAAKVMNDEESLKKLNAASDQAEVFSAAASLGFTGTEEEFKDGMDDLKNGKILDQEISKEDLQAVAGGGNRCAPSVCADTYKNGENCAMNDQCNHFLNFYPH